MLGFTIVKHNINMDKMLDFVVQTLLAWLSGNPQMFAVASLRVAVPSAYPYREASYA